MDEGAEGEVISRGGKEPHAKDKKKPSVRREEEQLREREQALMEGAAPQSPEDFERLLLSAPNSSYLWIQYMAHYLGSADIEAARRTADKALRSIAFREEEVCYNH